MSTQTMYIRCAKAYMKPPEACEKEKAEKTQKSIWACSKCEKRTTPRK
ncbi:hypothetical protein ANO14919_130480 [Xylariales sp. No.14919]|nr:hypothetical protein ANO14919_130480 [Xylariales sp. No.14919]